MLEQPIFNRQGITLGWIVYASDGIRWVSARLTPEGIKRFTNDFGSKRDRNNDK